MKNAILLPVIFICTSVTLKVSAQHKLIKTWETDSTLKVPESVLFDNERQLLYVANIDGKPDEKDGKGSIGKVGLDGKIIAVDWVTGLNAPKGMALVKNMLWVADLDQLAVIDIGSGTIVKHVPVPNAIFLNDVTAAEDGTIYVSDSRTKMVHRIVNDKSEVYLSNMAGPNGLKVYRNQLYALDKGGLYKVGEDRKLTKIADGMEESTDGLEPVAGDDFLVSCWVGSIYYVKGNGTKEHLLDTQQQKINSADIGFDPKKGIVYVPTFFKNSIVAYKLQ